VAEEHFADQRAAEVAAVLLEEYDGLEEIDDETDRRPVWDPATGPQGGDDVALLLIDDAELAIMRLYARPPDEEMQEWLNSNLDGDPRDAVRALPRPPTRNAKGAFVAANQEDPSQKKRKKRKPRSRFA